jgi:hypothetical protein
MAELWRYFNKDYWEHFQKNVVDVELPKYLDFYLRVKSDGFFEDDINRTLAGLSPSMFNGDFNNYKKMA